MSERVSNVNGVKVEQVIHVESILGKGIDNSDPVRVVHEYYTMDGVLIVRVDPWKDGHLNSFN